MLYPKTCFDDGVLLREMGMRCYLRKTGQGDEKPGVRGEIQLFLGCAGVPFLDICFLFPLLLHMHAVHRQRR